MAICTHRYLPSTFLHPHTTHSHKHTLIQTHTHDTVSAVYEGEGFVHSLFTDDNIHTLQMLERKVNEPPPPPHHLFSFPLLRG